MRYCKCGASYKRQGQLLEHMKKGDPGFKGGHSRTRRRHWEISKEQWEAEREDRNDDSAMASDGSGSRRA